MRNALIALIGLASMVLATYGGGSVYSLGSATTSIQGALGSGDTYSIDERGDFRPVALSNGSYFDAHIGFFELATPIPTPPPSGVSNICVKGAPDQPRAGDSGLLLAIIATVLGGAVGLGINRGGI